MDDASLVKVIRQICAKDKRYHPGAYFFMMEALDYTARTLEKHTKEGVERHVTGAELLEGIRAFTVQQFGPMSLTVLGAWGVKKTRDFGALVFNLVEAGKPRKTDADRIEDFDDVYDFHEAFAKPFLPKNEARTRSAGRPRRPVRRSGRSNKKGGE